MHHSQNTSFCRTIKTLWSYHSSLRHMRQQWRLITNAWITLGPGTVGRVRLLEKCVIFIGFLANCEYFNSKTIALNLAICTAWGPCVWQYERKKFMSMFSLIFSQCRDFKTQAMDLGVPATLRARDEWWMFWSPFIWDFGLWCMFVWRRYPGYRYGPESESRYEYTPYHWLQLCARLTFIIVFEVR